jgi:hypothetical protein
MVVYWSLFGKLGETCGTSTFHLSNFEGILEVMRVGAVVLDRGSAYARLAWPTHPSRTN